MIIHRDYFEHGQSRIKIYQDRIEMYNPGPAPKTVEEIIEDEVTEPRNPIIAKVFRMIGWAEVAGSGMMKILKNWKAAGYVEPSIKNNIQGYSFKMIFPFKEMSDEYRIGIKGPIKEDAFAGSHLVERSLYDFVNDFVDIDRVEIYREGEDREDLIFIGEAVLVEGARTDVEQTFPTYPMNYKAGWGYMMLTNFLPNGGNGTFTIYAAATDTSGNSVTLGTKTITCDNANAVKPFGAIDTPTQGGIASGSRFVVWGWALTPRPNSIPTDGSTINVYVDGVNLGYPTYNIYRPDIAGLFPSYANSNGAAGYFILDTTAYENGVHTIQWVVSDNGGNTDGIGSRYFVIRNSN
jgi:hypothetical protein